EHRYALFPHFHIAHVGFGIPTDIRGIEPILDTEGTTSGCGALKQRHPELSAVLALTAHFYHRAVYLTDKRFFLKSAADETTTKQSLKNTEGRQQKRPGRGSCDG